MFGRVFIAVLAFFFLSPMSALAQESTKNNGFEGLTKEQQEKINVFLKENPLPFPSADTAAPSVDTAVSCFDYYKFGSVQVDLSAALSQTVPGVPMNFIGTVKNDNTYPIVDGRVYVKIFRTGGDEDLVHRNGYALVDQFTLPDVFTLPAKGGRPVSFSWKVPDNAQSGDYMAAFFFATAKRYNLLGLSFTDDVTGNQAHFSVTSDFPATAAFDKNRVTLNGEQHLFAAFPLHFTKDESVEAKVRIVNPKAEPVIVPVIWKLYAWDSLREETLKDTRTELVELKANETKELAYAAKPIGSAVSYLVAETKDGDAKSILDIRFVRDGIEETRINFPGITDFPLTGGKQTTLFSCIHSTNFPLVKGNLLTLTLRDGDGNPIRSYRYDGDVTGDMMGVKDDFVPGKTYDRFSLTATLERNGKVLEEVTERYDCRDIDPNLCSKNQGGVLPTDRLGKGAVGAILGTLVVLLVLLGWKLWRDRRRNAARTLPLLFAIVLAGTLFGAKGAEAESVTWDWTYDGMLAYFWNADGKVSGDWAAGLRNPQMHIVYYANVYDQDRNLIIPSDAVISVGTKLSFKSRPLNDRNISWNGTGYSGDSPYGYWVEGAAYPSPGNCSMGYVGMIDMLGEQAYQDWVYAVLRRSGIVPSGTYARNIKVYVPFSAAPPSLSFVHSGTAKLSCNAAGDLCTVLSPGSIRSSVVFSATRGKFYYDYYEMNTISIGPYFKGTKGCHTNNIAMRAAASCPFTSYGSSAPFDSTGICSGLSTSDFVVDIPSMSVELNREVVSVGNPPLDPSVNAPSSGNVGVSYAFGAVSHDPDGDSIRYGFDWNNDGVVDKWVPASGYAQSDSEQVTSHSWNSNSVSGLRSLQSPSVIRPYKVIAQDSNGLTSGWTSASFTSLYGAVSNGVCGPADTVTGGVSFASAPTVGFCTDGSSPILSGTGPWTWTCAGSGGGNDAFCSASLQTPAPTIAFTVNGSASDIAVGRGDSLAIAWSVTNAAQSAPTSCTALSGIGFDTGNAVSGTATVPANDASLYQLSCVGPGGTTVASVSVTLRTALKICPISCTGGGIPYDTLPNFSTMPVTLHACYGTGTCTVGDNPVVGTWTANDTPDNAVSLSAASGQSTDVSATYSGSGSANEDITLSCPSCPGSPSPVTARARIACVAPVLTCDAERSAICPGSFVPSNTVKTDACGHTLDCSGLEGTRYCDMNWKEVTPGQ